MKSFVVALCVIAVAAASSIDQAAVILRSDNQQDPEGNFNYAYETDNGITGQASGVVNKVGKDAILEVSGSNRFKSPEGESFETSYIANQFGYQPSGAHLPTPPPPQPIPDYILRAIAYNAAHPYVEPKKL